MKESKLILFIDAIINLLLGILLIPASSRIADFIGVPPVEPGFYPSLLGAVLFGIGIALLIETFKGDRIFSGLGLYGAIAINICAGFVLALWLVIGELHLPLRGLIFLWTLVFLLIIISIIEFINERKSKR
jgi:hypothetical protein